MIRLYEAEVKMATVKAQLYGKRSPYSAPSSTLAIIPANGRWQH